MSNEQQPTHTMFLQAIDIGPGKIILYTDKESFFEQIFTALNSFAIDVARSDTDLGDITAQREDVEASFAMMSEKGLDTSDIDKELQARYTKALEASIETLVMGITSTVLGQLRSRNVIIRPN